MALIRYIHYRIPVGNPIPKRAALFLYWPTMRMSNQELVVDELELVFIALC